MMVYQNGHMMSLLPLHFDKPSACEMTEENSDT